MKAQVAIIMGSDSDLPVMRAAVEALDEFHIPHFIEIVSAHRTPEKMIKFGKTAEKKGIRVIIAGAGGAAHLPGMVAAVATIPVVGVPVMIGHLKGLDALLSVVQMPKGVPVATVAVNNAFNAGLLAVKILAASDLKLQRKLKAFQQKQKLKVKKSNQNLKKDFL